MDSGWCKLWGSLEGTDLEIFRDFETLGGSLESSRGCYR